MLQNKEEFHYSLQAVVILTRKSKCKNFEETNVLARNI